jgi:hypothetical protein
MFVRVAVQAGWCRAVTQVRFLRRPRGRLPPLLRRQLGKVHPGRSSIHAPVRRTPSGSHLRVCAWAVCAGRGTAFAAAQRSHRSRCEARRVGWRSAGAGTRCAQQATSAAPTADAIIGRVGLLVAVADGAHSHRAERVHPRGRAVAPHCGRCVPCLALPCLALPCLALPCLSSRRFEFARRAVRRPRPRQLWALGCAGLTWPGPGLAWAGPGLVGTGVGCRRL